MGVSRLWIVGAVLIVGTLLCFTTTSGASLGRAVPDEVAGQLMGGECSSKPGSFDCYDDGYILDCDAETCHTLKYDLNGDSQFADEHEPHACGGGYFYSCGSCHTEEQIVDCS